MITKLKHTILLTNRTKNLFKHIQLKYFLVINCNNYIVFYIFNPAGIALKSFVLFFLNKFNHTKLRMSYIDCAPFHTSVRVDQLMNEVETLYTNVLESGDRARAMQRLRVPPLEEKQPRIVTFRLGMYIGMILF